MQQQPHASAGILRLQQLLLLFKGHLRVLRDIIGKRAGLSCAHDMHDHIAGHLGHQRRVFHKKLLRLPHHGKIALRGAGDLHFGQKLDVRQQEGLLLRDLAQQRPIQPLHQHTDAVAGDLQDLADLAVSAHAEQILLDGIVHGDVSLRDQKDPLAVGHGIFHGLNGFLPAHIKVEQRAGKYSNPPQGQRRHLAYDLIDCNG